MRWRDQGFVVNNQRYGERGFLVWVLTAEHGLHAGYTRGHSIGSVPLPGSIVDVQWQARLSEHVGRWHIEEIAGLPSIVMGDTQRLAAMLSALAIIRFCIPERDPCGDVFRHFYDFYRSLDSPHWAEQYGRWELRTLAALGYGIDVRCCVVTGDQNGLVRISPRSGCAVSQRAAENNHQVHAAWSRLLPLPQYWLAVSQCDGGNTTDASTGRIVEQVSAKEICDGLRTTGYFLRKMVQKTLPYERDILIRKLTKQAHEKKLCQPVL